MDEAELKAKWLDFAKRLRLVGMSIFDGTSVKITEQGSADIRIVGLMLLARTLSNLKAAIALTEGAFIVEAKVIARCCFENSYWVGALVKEGDKFRASMVQHEMKHKRMRAQTIFSTAGGLEGKIGLRMPPRGQYASQCCNLWHGRELCVGETAGAASMPLHWIDDPNHWLDRAK